MIRALALLWSLGPLLWQLLTSLRPPDALVGAGSALPGAAAMGGWTLANYRLLLMADPPFWRYLLNSSLVGLAATALTLVLALPCAYGLQRLRGGLRWATLTALLAASLFPTVLLFLALLEWARRLGLANHLLALALPYAALSLPLAILLLRSALADLPPELEDAAQLEGLGPLQRLRFVLLPLLGPAIGSTAILVFLFSWNEYPPGSAASPCSPCPPPSPASDPPRCSPFPTAPTPPPPCSAACRWWSCCCCSSGRSCPASPRRR